nr:acyl-CoA thioesterase [uncultured Pseudomonas sp.]
MATITLKAVAHPWLCDTMGHMNVRHYSAFFDDAAFHFVASIGNGLSQAFPPELGWADVRHVVEFKEEVKAGALLTINSHLKKVGRTSLTFGHVMSDQTGTVHATMEVVTVLFDLNLRQATMLPESFRDAAGLLISKDLVSNTD